MHYIINPDASPGGTELSKLYNVKLWVAWSTTRRTESKLILFLIKMEYRWILF